MSLAIAVLRWLLRLLIVAAGLWGAGALWFHLPPDLLIRAALLPAWLAVCIAGLWGLRRGRGNPWLVAICGIGVAGLLWGWSTLRPQQERDWADDVARRLRAEVHGERVVLHNVRAFDWRGEHDYDVRWETREYDLGTLRDADLALSYWMGPAIAHTLITFGFEDGSRVVFSLEIRKERGESFSALGGFFRSFEETLVAADERDILRVRTNARGEDMYLYRLDIPPAALREVFLGYVAQARELDRAPRFYNTLTSNCTTIVFALARQLEPDLPLDWRLLASGYFAEYAYDQHGLLPGYTFDELAARGHITARARAADADPAFSQRIREGLPLEPAR